MTPRHSLESIRLTLRVGVLLKTMTAQGVARHLAWLQAFIGLETKGLVAT